MLHVQQSSGWVVIDQLMCLFHGSISVLQLFADWMVEHRLMQKSLTIISDS